MGTSSTHIRWGLAWMLAGVILAGHQARAETQAGVEPQAGVELRIKAEPRVERRAERRTHLGAELLTDFPLQLGGKLWVEVPGGIQFSTSLGYLPGPYIDAFNGAMVAAGAYDRPTADLVRTSLHSSLIWRLHAGWRPSSEHGFYMEAGYGLVALGGDVSTETILSMVTAQTPPDGTPVASAYQVNSLLHMIDAELGWRWILWKGLSLRAALGFAGTVGARTQIRPSGGGTLTPEEAVFTSAAETYLNSIYRRYGLMPTATLAAGWRFF